jgi:alkylation response protein AidB-like acyl-CoA dehydrogenase
MTGTLAATLIDRAFQERLGALLEERAPRIDAGELAAQSTVRLLVTEGLLPTVERASPRVPAPFDLLRAGELLATVAWFDLASAFSLWCHMMTMLYLAWAEPGSVLREQWLGELTRAERDGSTALATALGHAQTGRPLPVQASGHASGGLVLNGFVPWASNLTERFLVVTPVQSGSDTLVVAVPSETPGVFVEPCPRLLALQATASTTLRFQDALVAAEFVLARDALAFLRTVQPAFLALQASFCWGLAARALAEARGHLRGVNVVFEPDIAEAEAELTAAARALRSLLAQALGSADHELRCRALELRLATMRLACRAVALEAKTKGGQAYRAESGTARRLRESLFLPIQTPTEGQLLWELQRSNWST